MYIYIKYIKIYKNSMYIYIQFLIHKYISIKRIITYIYFTYIIWLKFIYYNVYLNIFK